MEIKLIASDFDKEIFNSKAVHPLQAWQWGEARKKMGIEVLRIGEFDDVGTGRDLSLQNVYQMTIHPLPFFSFKIGYLPRSRFPSKQVLDFLHDYGKKNNIIFIKIEPNEKHNPDLGSKISDLKSNIIRSPHSLFPDWTIIMDLKPSEEELMRKMKEKTRYNIRLAIKKGVVIKEESNERGLKTFIKLYFDTCKRQGYFGHSPEYHQEIWNHLKNNIAHILIAYYNDEPVAAYELFYFNKTFYYPYGGSSLIHRNVMAANLIMWESIKLGKKLEADTFDMWGSLSPEYKGDESWKGFTRFKEGYGGEFVRMAGSYDLITDHNKYNLYTLLNNVRSFFLKLKRIIRF